MSELFDKVFLAVLDTRLMEILNKQLTRTQKTFIRNLHKLSSEQKQEFYTRIKKETYAKAERAAIKEQLRRLNKSRPRSKKNTLPI